MTRSGEVMDEAMATPSVMLMFSESLTHSSAKGSLTAAAFIRQHVSREHEVLKLYRNQRTSLLCRSSEHHSGVYSDECRYGLNTDCRQRQCTGGYGHSSCGGARPLGGGDAEHIAVP